MTTLLIAEHTAGKLSDASARALTAVWQLGAPVHVLVAGVATQAVAEAASTLAGVEKVLQAEHNDLQHGMEEPLAALIVSLAGDYDVLAAAATSLGKSVMPRVAAKLDVMQVSDVSAIVGPDTFKRPVYAGNAVQTVRSSDATKVLTIRAASFAAAGDGSPAPIQPVPVVAVAGRARHVSASLATSDRPELAGARIVVAGGRGLGSKDKFDQLILPIADRLGAAVGASRAAVDAGFAPNDWQVGQTGKIVAPDLYIAIGISGAIQHLAGMKEAKVIVAINSDAEAPIFQVADYGIVGDLFALVPELTSALADAG